MELKDIQELMKVMKEEKLEELKVQYGKVKLTLINSCDASPKINIAQPVKSAKKEEKVQKEEIGDNSLDWYYSLSKLLEQNGLSVDDLITSNKDSMFVAQKLLGFPVKDSLVDFYNLKDGGDYE